MSAARFAQLWHLYLDQPKEISVETLARCNAACTFCPYPTLERIGTQMPTETVYRLIDEMATWKQPFHFSPFKVNEPFLDKRLRDFCERFLAKCPAGHLRLFTNGSALTFANVEWVAKLDRLEHLWISLNEYRPEEYKALMGIPFERTAKNLDMLHEEVDRGAFPHKVMLSCVGFPNEPFRRYCFDRWPLFDSTAIKKDAWIDFTDPQVNTIPPLPCIRWFELSIMADGKVALCCMDGTGEYAIGDITQRTMLDVYNSPVWRERREGLWSRKRVDPCSRCTY